MTRPQLIGSVANNEGGLDRVRDMASRYYFGSNVTLHEESDGCWRVHTGKGPTKLTATIKGKRIRLEIPAQD